MKSAKSKALVLGGEGGLLGQALVGVLKEKGWQVAAIGRRDIDFFSPSYADELAAMLDRVEPDCVFNTVAYTQVEVAEEHEEEAVRLNKVLPATLGRLLKERPACHLVHYSTDFVFDGKKETPYRVDDAPNPLSAYGRTKYAGEQTLMALDLPGGMIIRSAWLFGPGKKNFVTTILGLCRDKKNLKVVHNQIGSPTYTVDLARHTLSLVDLGASGLFHIVNGGQASWCELADEAVSCVQLECQVTPVESAEYPQKALRPPFSVLDCSRFTQLTGVVPRPWPQALREYLLLEYSA